MIRVGFTFIGGRNWLGGYNYLLNLVRCLQAYQQEGIRPVLFFGTDVEPEFVQPFRALPGVELYIDPAFDDRGKPLALAQALVLGRAFRMVGLMRRHGIDVVFEAAQFFGWRSGIPAIAWLADFQHRFMPQQFGRLARLKRDAGFRMQIASGRHIMLSSEDSRAACERFYPSSRGQTSVVHFATPPITPLSEGQVREIAELYGLPGRYFFLPNQFWKHKNHALVVEALRILAQQGNEDVVVVSTGKQHDPRNPEHAQAVLAMVDAYRLDKRFVALGMIPYAHLQALLQGSTALLNPSLFEGWSTPVEEAKALGVPMLLSDIPVHLEQASGLAAFFEAHSAESLARALAAFPVHSAAERLQRQQNAYEMAVQHQVQFAAAFAALATRMAESRKK